MLMEYARKLLGAYLWPATWMANRFAWHAIRLLSKVSRLMESVHVFQAALSTIFVALFLAVCRRKSRQTISLCASFVTTLQTSTHFLPQTGSVSVLSTLRLLEIPALKFVEMAF